MARFLVYHKTHGKAKLFLDYQVESDSMSGEEMYSLMPAPGTIYPIIQGRTEWKDPIELYDSIYFGVDREFMFEAT